MPTFHSYMSSHVVGFAFLAVTLPCVVCTVGSSVLWSFVDPVTPRVLKFINRKTEKLWAPFCKNPLDASFVNLGILHGIILPAILFYCFMDTYKTGVVSLKMCFLYHLFRLGPYFNGFAYANTLCHKEGHTRVGFFKGTAGVLFSRWWNNWIGLYYGLLPTTFSCGHTINHHQYNNDEEDCVTTWDRPRDSFLNYVRYLPRWLLYSCNLSSAIQFAREKKYNIMGKMIMGTFMFFAFVGAFAYFNPLFAALYLLYPFFESALLLSAINWAWHCFLDPDTENDFASSVTLFDSDERTNILNEDFHVVHHTYPGAHWTAHPDLYKKHEKEYIENNATCLKNTHAMEIFFLAILKKYDVFAEKWVDLSGKMTHEEKKALIIKRLQTCSWGPYKNSLDKKTSSQTSKAKGSKKTK